MSYIRPWFLPGPFFCTFVKNIIMPSFDIASAVDIQVLDNAINTVKKEVATRYDFRDTDVKVDLNKKDFIIAL